MGRADRCQRPSPSTRPSRTPAAYLMQKIVRASRFEPWPSSNVCKPGFQVSTSPLPPTKWDLCPVPVYHPHGVRPDVVRPIIVVIIADSVVIAPRLRVTFFFLAARNRCLCACPCCHSDVARRVRVRVPVRPYATANETCSALAGEQREELKLPPRL